MRKKAELQDYKPIGIAHEVGELTVLHGGQQSHYNSALLITFEDAVSLQNALELKHCSYFFEYEYIAMKRLKS
ncbi:hypothetical protein [Phytohalomonas tamaricis]|uniref:hypothetical protein n=1 Tax=Phytohalomonas tamaricis TaxID=2081032 RepID=UPI000D0B4205|nr:hypothetical protein [Phytohalomonas tamaricis]